MDREIALHSIDPAVTRRPSPAPALRACTTSPRKRGEVKTLKLTANLCLTFLCTFIAFAQSSPRIPNPESRIPTIHLQSPLEGVIPEVTSSFGERRLTHFHSGYDFSTDKEIGWRVVAPADGEIYRMKVERRGYGRALYIRHAGGFSTTYGHLFAYEDEVLGLEKRVKSAQASGGRYPGDIYPDPPIKVKAGQLVALAGEAGVGLPHLHFELRLNEEPVDPAVYSDLKVEATGQVEIPALWVSGYECTVNGLGVRVHNDHLYEIPLSMDEDGIWRNSGFPNLIGGYCRLSIEARDLGGRSRAVNELAVTINDMPHFDYSNHHFTFANYFEAGWIFHPDASNGGKFVYNLFPPTAGSGVMLFNNTTYDDGWVLRTGEYKMAVHARALGGESRAMIYFKRDDDPNNVGVLGLLTEEMIINSYLYTVKLKKTESVRPYDWTFFPTSTKSAIVQEPWSVTFPEQGLPGGNIAGRPIPTKEKNSQLTSVDLAGIEFIPSDFYTREPMILSAKTPDTSHTDIYFWDDNKNKWEAMNAVKGAGVLTSKVRGLGKFALFEDHVAPVVTALQSQEEPKLNLRRWYWPASDIGEGIDVEGCRATVKKKSAGAPEVEYDPDREWVQFYRPLDWQPPKGLSVSCTDRAGNSSSGVKRRPLKRWHRKKRRR